MASRFDKAVAALLNLSQHEFEVALRTVTDEHAHEYAWPSSEKKLTLAKLEVYLASLNERALTRQARADEKLAKLRKRKAA